MLKGTEINTHVKEVVAVEMLKTRTKAKKKM